MNRLLVFLLVASIAACSSSPPAPVEERSTVPTRDIELEADGRYSVRKGDSLWMIAFHFGLDHRQLAQWNGIPAPFVIYPGQLLTVKQPPARTVVQTRPARPPDSPPPRATEKPAPSKPPVAAPVPEAPARTAANSPSPKQAPVRASEQTAAANPSAPSWQWPIKGRLLRGFLPNNPARGGYDISGTEGQEIASAAAGRVVYSGSGLIGYGELIIIKHNDRLLSAYAHNRRRLVVEGEDVSAGQIIAEMGRNDRNEVILHFEIRVDGRPVDPAGYLPKP